MSSAFKMKYLLLPVAIPRLIWKKSEMIGMEVLARTLSVGKRDHFDS